MSQTITTQILPTQQQFAKIKEAHALHHEAICVFLATGFFLDQDTFWKDEVCLLPAHIHKFDDEGFLTSSSPWFEWHYSPRAITFETALEEYVALLTKVMNDQVADRSVILPISGGLDSRSQAKVLKDLGVSVQAYSYSFSGGYPEHQIAKQIAETCNFSFQHFLIKEGYLWDCIDDLALINGCHSEFTHPRQMAILQDYKNMQGVFSLGHWGDVLFDRGVPAGTSETDVVPMLYKKMVKPKGFELAEKLWGVWGLTGNFKDYLVGRIENSLNTISIDNLSAKVRAFKTSQWAHRWTTTNLSIFESVHPITLPYYDNRMLEFICTIPEVFLADRKLQIAHLKQDTALAHITWQDHKPYNLTNYHKNKLPNNLLYRVKSKLKRELQGLLGRPYVQRNWELQFEGKVNKKELEHYLFDADFNSWIPKTLIAEVYSNFKTIDRVGYSHAVSMLLTLSLWHKHFNNNGI
ncbi:asparagine synthase-related protein [Hanstruepera ponticola]|uniref:asparagine synthase-related protein n=1 Tax=Hanstruepera ponticola TaxID=2042995 RepID=UPI00177E5585|nr:asparagine synthase-related protein [Hanstruepera ponticola]